MTNENTEDPLPFSRRRFVQLSAATAGALTLPGAATASADAEAMTAEYRYVTNHTPADYEVPTLVTFTDASGPSTLADRFEGVVTTTEPRPAAYAHLTTEQAVAVAELPTAETLSHSPGSNPFWRLGYYPFGVFPEPERSTGFVDYEQMISGLKHLESEHPQLLNFYALDGDDADDNPHAEGDDVPDGDASGRSPGHLNYLTDREDPKGIYVAEVTNFDSKNTYEEKEKVFYSLSLHGLERAGAEAGSRFIERLLRGNESKTARLLDDVVLVFCYTNPDGWVAKHPQYESGWQLTGPEQGAPVVPFYERGNAEVFDTNRQYPTVGWLTTAHYPGEPNDPAERSVDKVPDAISIVEHFRTYENLNYGADLHGMLWSPQFVLGLVSQDQFDSRQLHELYEMNRVVDDVLETEMDRWNRAAELQRTVTGDANASALGFDILPEQAFDYGGIWDTIGYTVSGAMGDWMAHPPITDGEGNVVGGGLDMTTMDFEMAYTHMVGSNVYNPEIVRMQVLGYQTAIQTIARYAYENSDTPGSDDQFEASIETGGESVAYVTTDRLTRSSEDLSFNRPDGSSLQEADRTTIRFSGTLPAGGPGPAATTATHTFHTDDFVGDPEMVLSELSWTPQAEDLEFALEYPDGDRAEQRTGNNPEVLDKGLHQEGEYTFVVESYVAAGAQYEITAEFPEAELTEEAKSNYDTGGGSNTSTASAVREASVAPGETATASYTVEDDDRHSLTVHVHGHEALYDAVLVSPAGEVVREFEAVTEQRVGGRCCGNAEWTVKFPEPGEWTVRLTNRLQDAKDARVRFGTLASTSPHPDPEEALGYEQTPYEVSPFPFFEDLAEFADGPVEPLTVEEVARGNGAKLRRYDHVVVIHDDGVDDADYVAALDRFVDDGGNLVLTDSGVNLLGAMENDLASGVSSDDVERDRFYVAHLGEKDLEHPLLVGENPPDGEAQSVRPIQKQLWKIVPLGYSTSVEAPMTLVDPEAFRSAGGTASVAATTGGLVSAGSITGGRTDDAGIHVVGSLLPPANQSNLHPFGLLDYTTSFLGYLVLTNALGFQQVRRTRDGSRRFGRTSFEHPQQSSGGSGGSGPVGVEGVEPGLTRE